MRFIHAADLHLDSPLVGLSRYEGAPVDLFRSASRRSFQKLVDLAIARNVDFVLLAGDIFDGDWKDYSTGLFFNRELKRLSCPVFLIRGNHDAASKMTKKLRLPEHVHLLSHKKPETKLLPEFSLAVHGQSYSRSAVYENIAQAYPEAVPGAYNIGLLHTSLNGRAGHAPYAPCSIEDLKAKGYDYWALGHVHGREVISRDPWIVFPGCLQGRSSIERGPKGCILMDGEPSFHPLDSARWEELTISTSSLNNPEDLLALFETKLLAYELPTALRLFIEGRGCLYRQMREDVERWEAELRDVASTTATLWLEKIIWHRVPEVGGNQPSFQLSEDELKALFTPLQAKLGVHAEIPGDLAVRFRELVGEIHAD